MARNAHRKTIARLWRSSQSAQDDREDDEIDVGETDEEPTIVVKNHDPVPAALFHYTTAQGLLGIVTRSVLWASDVRFLNDEQEGVYARDTLERSLRDMPNPVKDPAHWAHAHGESAVRTFDEYIRMTLDALDTGYGIYASCLCENGDLLSQWRAYGSGHGYSVEFDPEALAHSIDVLSLYPPASGLRRVRYGTDAAKDLIESALRIVAEFQPEPPRREIALRRTPLALRARDDQAPWIR